MRSVPFAVPFASDVLPAPVFAVGSIIVVGEVSDDQRRALKDGLRHNLTVSWRGRPTAEILSEIDRTLGTLERILDPSTPPMTVKISGVVNGRPCNFERTIVPSWQPI